MYDEHERLNLTQSARKDNLICVTLYVPRSSIGTVGIALS